jgi:uncharacterized protein DUF3558
MSWRRSVVGSACLLVAVLAVGACSDKSIGSPVGVGSTTRSPATSSGVGTSTSSEDDLPSNGAPPVTEPLNPSRYLTDPCATLTQAQTSELKVGNDGVQKNTEFGHRCIWQNNDTGSDVDVLFMETNHRGLSGVYGGRSQLQLFEETQDIEGHPAVIAGMDERATGGCSISIGLTDQLAVQVSSQQSNSKVGTVDPCSVTTRVATMMLKTMKAGS